MRISLDEDSVTQNKRAGRQFETKDQRQPQLGKEAQIIEQTKPLVSAELKQKAE